MNINKFTQKSLQAVQDCERIASGAFALCIINTG